MLGSSRYYHSASLHDTEDEWPEWKSGTGNGGGDDSAPGRGGARVTKDGKERSNAGGVIALALFIHQILYVANVGDAEVMLFSYTLPPPTKTSVVSFSERRSETARRHSIDEPSPLQDSTDFLAPPASSSPSPASLSTEAFPVPFRSPSTTALLQPLREKEGRAGSAARTMASSSNAGGERMESPLPALFPSSSLSMSLSGTVWDTHDATEEKDWPSPPSDYVVLTEKHSSRENEMERRRVVMSGGRLNDAARLRHPKNRYLSLEVTRSIGDARFKLSQFTGGKTSGVIATPYVRMIPEVHPAWATTMARPRVTPEAGKEERGHTETRAVGDAAALFSHPIPTSSLSSGRVVWNAPEESSTIPLSSSALAWQKKRDGEPRCLRPHSTSASALPTIRVSAPESFLNEAHRKEGAYGTTTGGEGSTNGKPVGKFASQVLWKTAELECPTGNGSAKRVATGATHRVDESPEQYLVLASDGLWEKCPPSDVATLMREACRKESSSARRWETKEFLRPLGEELVQAALNRGSADNITVLVVRVR